MRQASKFLPSGSCQVTAAVEGTQPDQVRRRLHLMAGRPPTCLRDSTRLRVVAPNLPALHQAQRTRLLVVTCSTVPRGLPRRQHIRTLHMALPLAEALLHIRAMVRQPLVGLHVREGRVPTQDTDLRWVSTPVPMAPTKLELPPQEPMFKAGSTLNISRQAPSSRGPLLPTSRQGEGHRVNDRSRVGAAPSNAAAASASSRMAVLPRCVALSPSH